MRRVPRVAALVLKIYPLSLLRRPRGDAILARAAVRLLCTQKPARRVRDMWAWAPMLEVGPLVVAKMRGALPRGGSMLLVRWFAFLIVGRSKDEGGVLPRGDSTLPVRRFAFFALEGQRASCMTCGTGPSCHGMDTPVYIGGGFSRRFEAGAGESAFKEGFIPRVVAMPCFSPTRGVLSPPSSLRPFAFKVSASRCRSLPWPCDFIPSVPRLSECSKWYTACLDGMRRRSAKGFAPVLSTPMSLPLESLCLLSSPACRFYQSCFSSAGGARPCGSSALPPVLGFKDVHQPRGGGERAESRLRLPHGLVLASSSSIRRKRMITSLVKEANLGYTVPARPQAPPSAVLSAPWLGWSCPHPRRGTEARTSSPWRAC
jgi:hypothetical protein